MFNINFISKTNNGIMTKFNFHNLIIVTVFSILIFEEVKQGYICYSFYIKKICIVFIHYSNKLLDHTKCVVISDCC